MKHLLVKVNATIDGDTIPAKSHEKVQIQIQKVGDLAPETFIVSILFPLNSPLLDLFFKIQPISSSIDAVRVTTSEINVCVINHKVASPGLIVTPKLLYRFIL